jgi:hypothetical protein
VRGAVIGGAGKQMEIGGGWFFRTADDGYTKLCSGINDRKAKMDAEGQGKSRLKQQTRRE